MSLGARTGAPRTQPRAGFTLIEALAAFAILATVTVVVHRGVVAATTSADRAAGTAAAVRVARTVLATPLSRATPVVAGSQDGLGWTLTTSALPFPTATVGPDGDRASWTPVRVRLAVATGAGRTLEVESVRLVRSAP